MKPFLRWAGGKQNQINELKSYLPAIQNINKYFEPFLGAGSMFFATNFEICYLSDINKDLINCYEAIKNNPKLIASSLERHRQNFINNDKYYYKVREKFNQNLEQESSIQAARFIFLIHSSFNGIYRVNSKGEYNVPIGKRNPALPTFDQLNLISKKLEGCHLSSCTFSDIEPRVNESDFIYLDPPYPPINGTAYFQHYTVNKFPQTHQEKVRDFAERLNNTGCYVMISNADTEMIRNLYSEWKIAKLEATRFISCKKKRLKVNELIITNY